MSNPRILWLAAVPCLVLLAACNRDPKVVSRKYVDSGNKYYDNGKYKEASIMYRRALSKDMRYADAWYRLGLTNLKLNLPGEARRDFTRAMEIDPTNIDATVKVADIDMIFYMVDPQSNRMLLNDMKDLVQQLFKKDPKSYDGLRLSGYIALMQKDRKTAIDKFQQANQVRPDQPDLVLSLVQALFVEEQDQEAEKLAKDLIAKQKTYGPIYDALYLHYVKNNNSAAAEDVLKQKIGNNPKQGSYLLQLAFHYYMSNRKAEMNQQLQKLTADSKDFPENHLLAGDFYVRIHDYDDAVLQYDQGAKENPKNRRLYQKKMVEALGTEGKKEQAIKLVAELMKEDPKDPEVAAMHATLLLEENDRGKVKAAISELQPLVSKMPGNVALHLNLGRAYMIAGDPQSLDSARIQLLEALKIDPKHVGARLALAELQLRRGENPDAVQSAGEVLNLEHANPSAHLVRASALMNMREYDKARDELTAVLKMYPQANEARFKLGELDYLEHKFKDADADFQALKDANDPRGVPGMIEAELAQGQQPRAIQLAESQVQKFPDRVDYRTELALVYTHVGMFKEAAREFQKLIDLKPKSSELYLHLGEAKKSAGDISGALEAFRKAKELDPRSIGANLDLALTQEMLGRNEEARTSYEEVLKLQPDNVQALNNLAYLKADGGIDLDQALEYAKRAQQKNPTDLNVIDTVALIYIRKNLIDDSLRMLHDLVNQRPNNPTYRLHLAMALYQKGERPLAKKELETALRNKPSEKEQAEIKQLLAKVG